MRIGLGAGGKGEQSGRKKQAQKGKAGHKNSQKRNAEGVGLYFAAIVAAALWAAVVDFWGRNLLLPLLF
jgi:hypothetical protein